MNAQWIQAKDAREATRLLDIARVHDCKAKVGVVFQGCDDKLKNSRKQFPSVSKKGQKAIVSWNVVAFAGAGSPEPQEAFILKSTFQAPQRKLPKAFVEPSSWREVAINLQQYLCKQVDVSWHSSQQWKIQELKPGNRASRVCKIEESKYAEALTKSGTAGVFFDEFASHRSSNSTLVVWHSPDQAEGLAYLKHVQAKANGKPLAFRKGGAKALGIRAPFEQNSPDTGDWRIGGVPVQWYEEDLVSALKGAGFTTAEVISKGNSRRPWLVRLQKAERICEAVLVVEVGMTALHLERTQPTRNIAHLVETSVRPARASHRVPTIHVAASQEAPLPAAAEKLQSNERQRSRSPPLKKEEPWYTLKECGGEGHCFYNCVAAGYAMQFEGRSWESVRPQISSRGRGLREQIATHIQNHAKEYRQFWCPTSDLGANTQ